MRYTVLPRMHLSRLPRSTRLLLTLFVLSVLGGLWVATLKYTQRAEFTPGGAARYWRGDSPARAADELLPGEAQIEDSGTRDGLAVAAEPRKTTRFLVDVIHPHVFTIPLLLFVLLHLLILTRLTERAKIACHLHAFASLAATLALPFLVAGSGRGGLAFVVAGANLMLSFVAVSAVLLFETWCARPDSDE
jgi:hypothetical protein